MGGGGLEDLNMKSILSVLYFCHFNIAKSLACSVRDKENIFNDFK